MQNLFSYSLKLEDMGKGTQTYNLEASANQLAYIAEIMQVPAVNMFKSEINVKFHGREHKVDVWGHVAADVEQVSVVSLENFVRRYENDFEMVFDTKMTLAEQMALDAEQEGENVPDVLDNGQIDLAAVAMEHLALILDDFPRKDGEVFEFKSEFDEETTQKSNPFAVLKKLKK